jgi:hypothetical protein
MIFHYFSKVLYTWSLLQRKAFFIKHTLNFAHFLNSDSREAVKKLEMDDSVPHIPNWDPVSLQPREFSLQSKCHSFCVR